MQEVSKSSNNFLRNHRAKLLISAFAAGIGIAFFFFLKSKKKDNDSDSQNPIDDQDEVERKDDVKSLPDSTKSRIGNREHLETESEKIIITDVEYSPILGSVAVKKTGIERESNEGRFTKLSKSYDYGGNKNLYSLKDIILTLQTINKKFYPLLHMLKIKGEKLKEVIVQREGRLPDRWEEIALKILIDGNYCLEYFELI